MRFIDMGCELCTIHWNPVIQPNTQKTYAYVYVFFKTEFKNKVVCLIYLNLYLV